MVTIKVTVAARNIQAPVTSTGRGDFWPPLSRTSLTIDMASKWRRLGLEELSLYPIYDCIVEKRSRLAVQIDSPAFQAGGIYYFHNFVRAAPALLPFVYCTMPLSHSKKIPYTLATRAPNNPPRLRLIVPPPQRSGTTIDF